MNTGIYYLYEYQADQKIRNTGFLKLTKQEHTCFLQLNARNLPVSSGDTAKLSVFYLKENNINAGEFADIPCQTRRISEKTSISELHFPNQYPLKQIDGFFLVLPGGKILAAASPGLTLIQEKSYIFHRIQKNRHSFRKRTPHSRSPSRKIQIPYRKPPPKQYPKRFVKSFPLLTQM